MDNLSVYVHIPFCEKKCNYCDFTSFSGKGEYFESYVNALINEIETCKELENNTIKTIFIGGGTPSVLPPDFIVKIMAALSKYSIAPDAEITIEANPNSLSLTKLKAYKAAGINRLSIGLQAWQNHLLERLGRLHRREDFLKCVENAKLAGFTNISCDLMFAIPNQTLADWQESLFMVTELGLKHISCYSLIIEENTAFFDDYNRGLLSPTDDELDRQMYYHAVNFLAEKGYEQYEISNFALENYDSRHNSIYWERGNYIGLGLNSHSLYNNVRFENCSNLHEYIDKQASHISTRQNFVSLTEKDIMEEFMFLGLRMNKGVSAAEFERVFGAKLAAVYGEVIDKHRAGGLLCIDGDIIKLTQSGIDLSNIVLSDFLF